MPVQADLDALVQAMSIVPSTTSPALGVPIVAGLDPLPTQITSVTTQVVNLALDWYGKGFAFTNALPDDTTTIAPLPVIDLTSVPPAVDPGVPGLLGKITGAVDLPLQATLDVSLQVAWRITDARETVTFQEGVHYVATPNMASPSINIWLAPNPVEDTDNAAPVVERYLRARVTVSAGGFTSVRELPPVVLVVPVLPVPRVLALFLHTSFNGAILVVVPSNALLGSASSVANALLALRDALTPLNAIVTIAAFIAGISTLVSRLQTQGHIEFRSANSIGNLNNITLIQRSWWQNDTEAEDELSSVILVGAPGSAAQCNNARSNDDDEGRFTITTGESLVAFASSLHSKTPASGPLGGELFVNMSPSDGWFSEGSFGDSLSSVRFV